MHTIHKIGGSVLKTPNQFTKIISSIQVEDGRHTLVVSALFGVTETLTQLTRLPGNITQYIKQILFQHFEWTFILLSGEKRRETNRTLTSVIKQLRAHVIEYNRTGNSHLYAAIISTGERLSAIIVNAFLYSESSQIIWPECAGFVTTNNALDAEYLIDTSILKTIFESSVKWSVIPGFYGVSVYGECCLVGRGGTDYTAAELALRLNADKLLFWKDSDGLQTVDPRIVDTAINVDHVSLHTLSLMSESGSEVLHPRVMQCLSETAAEIGFCNPEKGLQILTHVHKEHWISGKSIIVIGKSTAETTHTLITIISRNTTLALIFVSQCRKYCSEVRNVALERGFVRFSVPKCDVDVLVHFVHDRFSPKLKNGDLVLSAPEEVAC